MHALSHTLAARVPLPVPLQFLYGEDGMDGVRIEGQNLDHLKLDVSGCGFWSGIIYSEGKINAHTLRAHQEPEPGPPEAGREWLWVKVGIGLG